MKSVFQNAVLGFAFAVSLVIPAAALRAEADTTLEFPDGRVSQVELVRAGESGLTWKLPGATSSITTPYSKIHAVTFPPTEQWATAMKLFSDGNFKEATENFEKIAKARTAQNFYPAPGNFSTLAKRRLLDCYRELVDPYMVGVVSRDFEYSLLPPAEKQISSTIVAWALCGNKQWDQFFPEAEKALKAAPPASREAAEIALLKGLAFKSKMNDKPRQAYIEFCRVLTLDAGSSRNLGRRALREAAEIIKDDPLRQKELNALLHFYRDVLGEDSLWEDAPPEWVAIADSEVEKLGASSSQSLAMERRDISEARLKEQRKGLAEGRSLDGAPTAVQLPKTAPVVQLVRLQLTGNRNLALAELEIMSGGKNVALGGTVTMSGGGKTSGNLNDSVKDLACETGSGENPWVEIDLGTPTAVDKVIVWTAPGKKTQLEGFTLQLMDGSRRVGFQRENVPAPTKSLAIITHRGAAG